MSASDVAADLAADLMDALTEDDAREVWKWSGLPGEYPGRAAARVVLRACAREQGWRVVRKPSVRRMLRRAVLRGNLAALRRVLLLITDWSPAPVTAHGRKGDRMRPQAGHGSVAPVRGSPVRSTVALAVPGASPP